MPNHCLNYLDVKGNYKDMKKFIMETHDICKEVKEKYFKLSFEKINPTPIKEDGDIIDEWYEWRLNNWGTKWDCYDESGEIIIGDHTINTCDKDFTLKGITELDFSDETPCEYYICFCTAWAPPYKIYEWMLERYKELDMSFRASYHECGCGFAGHVEFVKGEKVEEVQVDSREPFKYWMYLVENDLESTDWMLESIFDELCDQYEDEEFRTKLFDKINEVFENEKATIKDKVKLFIDVMYPDKDKK